jgi:hypothetical protein
MRNLVLCGLIFLTLALNCGATASVQLNGSSGQAILSQIAVPVQINNTSANSGQTNNISTSTDLGNWGGAPIGYELNKSGILTPTQLENDGEWVPSI